jgi:hypothetical protein
VVGLEHLRMYAVDPEGGIEVPRIEP